MKKVFFLAMFMLCRFVLMAQSVPTATLHHDNDFKTFYSSNAFKEAMAEAQPGDVINLSAGTFVSAPITIPVTVRGAGIGSLDGKENLNSPRTSLSGTFTINIPDNGESQYLSMEGLECLGDMNVVNILNPIFSKMKIKKLCSSGDAKWDNITLYHCLFEELEPASGASILIFSSVFPGFNYVKIPSSLSITVNNSLLLIESNNYKGDNKNITYNNCIFDLTNSPSSFYQIAQAYDCVCVGGEGDVFGSSKNNDNAKPERNNRILQKDTPAFKDGTFYRLTDAAAAYLGSDGTQVGIYGSSLPFSAKTSYPQIKKFVVAPESTSDGKIKIELEIDADE